MRTKRATNTPPEFNSTLTAGASYCCFLTPEEQHYARATTVHRIQSRQPEV